MPAACLPAHGTVVIIYSLGTEYNIYDYSLLPTLIYLDKYIFVEGAKEPESCGGGGRSEN